LFHIFGRDLAMKFQNELEPAALPCEGLKQQPKEKSGQGVERSAMKKILLAAVATVAVSLPAVAQKQNMQPSESQMQQQPEMNQPGNQQQTQDEQQQRINPSELKKDQISQIQQALNKKGFNAKSDGVWGPNTVSALRNFQQKNNISANGQLTQETLAELGLKWAAQEDSQPSSSTTSARRSAPGAWSR
jgi:hypothetical protein